MFFLVFVLYLDCFFNMHLCAKLQPYRSKKYYEDIHENNTTNSATNSENNASSRQSRDMGGGWNIPAKFLYRWYFPNIMAEANFDWAGIMANIPAWHINHGVFLGVSVGCRGVSNHKDQRDDLPLQVWGGI